jgi:hypothetical protein
MTDESVTPLRGANIWLSGSIPEVIDAPRPERVQSFVAKLTQNIFRDGGSIIHGSHRTIWPILLKQAGEFQKVGGRHDCLTLAVSKQYSDNPRQHGIDMDAWKAHSVVEEVPAEGGELNKPNNLRRLRRFIAERCDAIVVVGGRGWEKNPGAAGIPRELELARERGLPCL